MEGAGLPPQDTASAAVRPPPDFPASPSGRRTPLRAQVQGELAVGRDRELFDLRVEEALLRDERDELKRLLGRLLIGRREDGAVASGKRARGDRRGIDDDLRGRICFIRALTFHYQDWTDRALQRPGKVVAVNG